MQRTQVITFHVVYVYACVEPAFLLRDVFSLVVLQFLYFNAVCFYTDCLVTFPSTLSKKIIVFTQ